jgi:hypothetical protein
MACSVEKSTNSTRSTASILKFLHERVVKLDHPGGIEMVDCGTREALIEQQHHRAWGRGKTLSSTKAAAKASACRISSSAVYTAVKT